MKKLICGLSALALLAMPVTASAEVSPQIPTYTIDETGTTWKVNGPAKVGTMVGYSVDPSFMVTIPATVEFTTNAEETIEKEVTVSQVTIPAGSVINVTLEDALNKETGSEFNLVNADDKIPYSISVGEGTANKIAIGENVVSFVYDGDYDGIDNNGEGETAESYIQKLNFTKEASTAKYAGRYLDALEFSVSCTYTAAITRDSADGTTLTTDYVPFVPGNTWRDVCKNSALLEIKEISTGLGTGGKKEVVVYKTNSSITVCAPAQAGTANVTPVDPDAPISVTGEYYGVIMTSAFSQNPQ